MSALQSSGQNVPNIPIRDDTYELCYNSACMQLGQDKYKEAEKTLRKAEELCRQTFGDDPDEDVDAELAIIRVQLGYTLQMQRRSEEALKLYNQVVKQRPADVGLAAVASNNIVTINKDQNVFDSKKKMKMATVSGLHQKLTSGQQRQISFNQCLLFMYTNQGDQCQRTAKSLQEKYPESETPSMIQAAYFSRDKQMSKAIDVLQDYASKQPEQTTVKLTLAQLYLTQGSVYKACTVLRNLGDLSAKPGVVSALVTLYLSQEDHDAAAEVFKEAIDWFRANKPQSKDLGILLRSCAAYHLRHGDPKVATDILEGLRKEDPSDMKIMAQLIAAYAKFDPKKAQVISRELPSVGKLSQDMDVDRLEAAFTSLTPKYLRKGGKPDPSPKAGTPTTELLKKKKKKKPGKLPKNCEPGIDLDSERWLPRRERSYYRGKRKDKRRDQLGKGTQGATSSTHTDLDANKSPSASGSELGSPRPGATTQPPAAAAAASGPRQQNPKPRQQKKKKKGGKW